MKFVPKIDWKWRKLIKTSRVVIFRHDPQLFAQNHVHNKADPQTDDAQHPSHHSHHQQQTHQTLQVLPHTHRFALSKDAASNISKQLAPNACFRFLEPTELSAQYDMLPRILPKGTKSDFMCDGSFQEAIGKVMLVAELFAFMPVKNVTAKHPKDMSFSWWNVRNWYCVACIGFWSFDLCLTMYKVLNRPITFNNIEPMIFRFSIILVCAYGLKLARKWPELMLYWHQIENELPQHQTQMDKRRMAHKILMVTFVAMMLSLSEHLMSLIAQVIYTNHCPITDDPIKNFFLMSYDEIFDIFKYSPIWALTAKLANILATFIWNYMDVFVMIVSIGLSSKFKQINDNLMRFKGLQMPETYWSERRVQYRNVCMLCEKMDSAISFITMVSFSNNLYFICVQLLRTLNKMPSFVHALYFYFSLSFLIGRTLAVSLYSASVNDESRKPLRVLRCVPKESWCLEVKRFSEEISSDLVALSGLKFFHLTRKLVLSVAGTIVTYELVLIQFHEDTEIWNCTTNSSKPHEA